MSKNLEISISYLLLCRVTKNAPTFHNKWLFSWHFVTFTWHLTLGLCLSKTILSCHKIKSAWKFILIHQSRSKTFGTRPGILGWKIGRRFRLMEMNNFHTSAEINLCASAITFLFDGLVFLGLFIRLFNFSSPHFCLKIILIFTLVAQSRWTQTIPGSHVGFHKSDLPKYVLVS